MTKQLVVIAHLEATADDSSPFVWWAETNAVERFSAAADSLPALMKSTRAALSELLGDDDDVQVRFELASDNDTATGDVDAPDRARPDVSSVSVLAG